MGKVYVDDTGQKLILETETDLSNATTKKIKVKKPSGVEEEWDANIEGNPSEGRLSYVIQSGDFSEAGTYKFQAYVEFSDGGVLHGETASLVVHAKYT